MIEIHIMTKEHPLWEQTISFAGNCLWSAGKLLADIMRNDRMSECERVIAACADGEIVGFCTFAEKDEMPQEYDFTPFVGFVFVDEKYRGNHLSGMMINKAEEYARGLGFEQIYVMSGEHGLYEKYGFECIGEYPTIYDWTDRLFVKKI